MTIECSNVGERHQYGYDTMLQIILYDFLLLFNVHYINMPTTKIHALKNQKLKIEDYS